MPPVLEDQPSEGVKEDGSGGNLYGIALVLEARDEEKSGDPKGVYSVVRGINAGGEEEGKYNPVDLESRAGPGNAKKGGLEQWEKDGQVQTPKNEVIDLNIKVSV